MTVWQQQRGRSADSVGRLTGGGGMVRLEIDNGGPVKTTIVASVGGVFGTCKKGVDASGHGEQLN